MALYVEADDRLLSPWFIITGRFEVSLTIFLLRQLRPDSHCIDVGANFGYFTCLMATHCPRGLILGMEADQHVADLAQDNVFINGLHERASVTCAAASDRSGELTLYRRTCRSGNTSIVDVGDAMTAALGEPPVEPFTVPSVTIDELATRFGGRVDFIKIDVEDAEPLVLAGARKVIEGNPEIVIVMEWSPGQITAAGFDLQEFVDQIAAMGLRCSTLDHGVERPLALCALVALPYQAGIVLRRAQLL